MLNLCLTEGLVLVTFVQLVSIDNMQLFAL